MVERKQAGFTLIEIVIVLAISTTMLGFVFSGLSKSQTNLQRTNSIDRAKEALLRVQADALGGVNLFPNAGEDPTTVNLGRMAVFTNGSSTVQVYRLTTANAATPVGGQQVTATHLPADDFELTYGLSPTSASSIHAVAFTRSLADAHAQTATFNPAQLSGLTLNQFIAPGSGTVVLSDSTGRTATITVNGSVNGISRSLQ